MLTPVRIQRGDAVRAKLAALGLTGQDVRDAIPFTDVVTLTDPPPAVPACRDPFDLPFLQLAATGQATLVTGDRDLLVLAGSCRIPILGIEAFIDGFGKP